MAARLAEFSFRTRAKALARFAAEEFDVLILGGGITGAATARDAAMRGLKVALVEKNDFAHGTSSKSSKLIHGGLRYLENLEFRLVFESLSERAMLLKTVPHMVRPLPFFLPVYDGDSHSKGILALGMWLYDILSLFRAPGFHKNLSREQMLDQIPFLKENGLQGGFRYFDASMWDDVLAVENLRAAGHHGAAIANYCEALRPIRTGERITGFVVRDVDDAGAPEMELRAKQVIVCAGPWTDSVGPLLAPKPGDWKPWLSPSKGVHLIFDLKRIPLPGALVMSHPKDGRISFVIPRPDYGAGVVIVGTTDGPTPADPDQARVESADIDYLLELLNRYFPELKFSRADIVSSYVGVRPLIGGGGAGSEGQSLQKVSREHRIDLGPGGTVVVAGGKYTTSRKMAQQIVDFALSHAPGILPQVSRANTRIPINPSSSPEAIAAAELEAQAAGILVPPELFSRYGAEALDIFGIQGGKHAEGDPDGFPLLESQLRYSVRNEMSLHLEDFYRRRVPLYSSRKDHGLPWAEALARVWAEERGLLPEAARAECERLRAVLQSI